MDRDDRICMGCMSPLAEESQYCPRCSYDNTIPNPRGSLAAGTNIGDGYVIGRVVRRNDLTITYLGLHTPKNIKVYVEEFYPSPLVERDADGVTIHIMDENRIRFKTLYSDIADRWKRLSKMDSRCLVKIRELFPALGTIYCVTTYMPHHTLEEQMDESGPMLWGEAKAAFLPLCTLVANLHNQGLTHCGVAPDNILVNRRGQLLLTGFALPELRTEGSGLEPELYSGYSAPEQYSKNLWQGEWTDVYSLGAVLYYIVTGVTPTAALERAKKDTLPDAAAVNHAVPDNVSEAIVKAMEPTKQNRFPSINEFTAALLQETTSNTAVFRSEPIKPEVKAKPAVGISGWQRSGSKLTSILAVLLGISIVANVILGTLVLPLSAPPSDSISSEPIQELMKHNFVGGYLKSIMDNRAAYQDLVLDTEYAYNEEYPADIIYDQSIKPGEPVPEDRTVVLKVSRGSEYLTMPYLIGSSTNFASKTLTDLGVVDFEYIYDSNPDSTGAVGTVTACNIGFGAKIARTDRITLTIKQNPPMVIEP